MTPETHVRSMRPSRFIAFGLAGLALSACTTLRDTGQTFDVDGVTHKVYAVTDPVTGSESFQVYYRNFNIFCSDMATCPEDIAVQKQHIDLVYRGEPD